MPITADRRALYPPRAEWLLIRKRILRRAKNRCEGTPAYPDCRARNGQPHPVTRSIVILTIGHLDHDPRHNKPRNLKAWCQRCHNTYDQPFRQANAARTRRRKSPQIDLFD
jgi:hypothetical protein